METGIEIQDERESRLRSTGRAILNLVRYGTTKVEPYLPAWVDDRLGYWPVNDRGGAMSEYTGPGDRGMLGVLARIEMNEEDGLPLDTGLPPDALRPRY